MVVTVSNNDLCQFVSFTFKAFSQHTKINGVVNTNQPSFAGFQQSDAGGLTNQKRAPILGGGPLNQQVGCWKFDQSGETVYLGGGPLNQQVGCSPRVCEDRPKCVLEPLAGVSGVSWLTGGASDKQHQVPA